jgi:hypothetical protein
LATTIATITTKAEGYYAFGGLGTGSYGIVPQYSNYVFSPKTLILRVPEANIRSYDFTAIDNLISTWGAIRLNTLQFYLTFNNDGRSSLSNEIPSEPSSAELTYTISGNQITFLDEFCGSVEEIYTYSINENTLSLVEVSDSCSRKTLLEGDWTRQ